MKLGTWGVKPPIAHFKKELNLVLAEQKGILRAVPPNSSKINFGTIFPGSLEKEKAADNIIKLLKRKISKEEVLGLQRTFAMYCKFPKEMWSEIKIAEKMDEEGNKKFAELSEQFKKQFFEKQMMMH